MPDDLLDPVSGPAFQIVFFEGRSETLFEGDSPRTVVVPRRGYMVALVDGRAAITCFVCGNTSHHPRDVTEKYCGFCHCFHEDRR